MPSIPPQSLIVVTGITGYIASHVGLAALQAGHRVRGTVRDLKRAQELRNAYAKQGVDITKLEFIVAWENATAEDKTKPEWAWIRYAATKILSEKAAWKWVEENKPPFDIVTILPNANFGPVLYGDARSTGFWIQSFLKGHNEFAESVGPQWFIDVRDDGRLHVAALTNPSLSGKRIWGVAEPTGWNQILAILRKSFPDANVAPDLVGEPGEPTKQKIENTVATEALGGWIGLEQSLVDTGKSLGF
ncbi:hypothetical protein IEO21_10229 [Rhodonia placenta]|uniref:NmrA-like domain-containing protein n=1 Tax=Rhodonia placenta TaxID=104341 RepID=A0A8H7NSU8_9APHY|nr:hypothetical protein IEO21_10229 [Postia placenta]